MSIADSIPDFSEAAFEARRAFETILAGAGSHRAVTLQVRAEALARHIRRLTARSAQTSAPGQAATQWLHDFFRQTDDALKRGAIAALALGLERRTAALPEELRTAYPTALARLAVSLSGARRYGEEAFSRDAALVSGLAVPVGAFNVFTPEKDEIDGRPLWTRRAATGFVRQALQFGPREAQDWLAAAGTKPWVELHLDVRALDDFNADGFNRSYRVIAALLRARPDLAGLYAASWLYDPQLAAVSPNLAFVRRTAEDGGARIVRLKVDPVQTAFAVARSPTRRALVETGAYRPACYAMYWPAADLIAWAERTRTAAQDEPRLQVVRK